MIAQRLDSEPVLMRSFYVRLQYPASPCDRYLIKAKAATSSLASQATRLWLTGVTALSIEETLRPIRIHELSEIGIPLLSHLPGEDRTACYPFRASHDSRGVFSIDDNVCHTWRDPARKMIGQRPIISTLCPMPQLPYSVTQLKASYVYIAVSSSYRPSIQSYKTGIATRESHTMNSSLTAIELGILSGSLIWGVTASQVFSYTESGKRDPVWLKSFVACIWLMETIHTAFSWVYLHTVTISDRDSPGKVGNIEWSFAACIVIQDCLSAAVQSLYAYRIYKISGRLLLAITQWIGALLRVIFILILLGYAIRAPSFEAVVHNHRGVTIVAVATSAWVDLLNTAMLCCVLVKRRRSGMKRTTRTIDMIIVWSVETGLLTSICAVSILIVMLIMPQSGVWEALMMIYARLYLNSLMVSLNARGYLRRISETGCIREAEIPITPVLCSDTRTVSNNSSNVVEIPFAPTMGKNVSK